MSDYTHRPTIPGDDRSQQERSVFYKGKLIGRVHQITYGPTNGKWWWTLEWLESRNSGVVDKRDAALNIIKNRHKNKV